MLTEEKIIETLKKKAYRIFNTNGDKYIDDSLFEEIASELLTLQGEERRLTDEEILDQISYCTITEEADLDDTKNWYYQHEDVLKALKIQRDFYESKTE